MFNINLCFYIAKNTQILHLCIVILVITNINSQSNFCSHYTLNKLHTASTHLNIDHAFFGKTLSEEVQCLAANTSPDPCRTWLHPPQPQYSVCMPSVAAYRAHSLGEIPYPIPVPCPCRCSWVWVKMQLNWSGFSSNSTVQAVTERNLQTPTL